MTKALCGHPEDTDSYPGHKFFRLKLSKKPSELQKISEQNFRNLTARAMSMIVAKSLY